MGLSDRMLTDEELEEFMEAYSREQREKAARNLETLLLAKFPGIQGLTIKFDPGLKLHYDDDRYPLETVWGYIASLLKT